jgi:hypothetical protein
VTCDSPPRADDTTPLAGPVVESQGLLSDQHAVFVEGVLMAGYSLDSADAVDGWYRDPYGRHMYRWFSAGEPTDLVRDDDVTSHDPPPDEPLVGRPEPAEEAVRPYDLVRAGDGEDPFTELESVRLLRRSAFRDAVRLAVFVLTIAAVGFLAWLHALEVVEVDGDTRSEAVLVGPSYYVDTGLRPFQPSGDVAPASVGVTVSSVTAHADRRTADGAVTRVPLGTVVCIRRPGTPIVRSATPAQLGAACSSVQPLVVPEFIDLGPAVMQILYEVPGTVPATYTGLEIGVDYSQGIRRANATGPARTTVMVKEAAR